MTLIWWVFIFINSSITRHNCKQHHLECSRIKQQILYSWRQSAWFEETKCFELLLVSLYKGKLAGKTVWNNDNSLFCHKSRFISVSWQSFVVGDNRCFFHALNTLAVYSVWVSLHENLENWSVLIGIGKQTLCFACGTCTR